MADKVDQADPLELALFHEAQLPFPADVTHPLLELYKTYVDSMEKVVSRRQTVHSFFLTANTLLLTFAGLLITKDFIRSGVSAVPLVISPIAGSMLSLVWMKLSRHYGLLCEAKFKVIHSLEKQLPAAPFLAEWVALGEGKNPLKYQSMATIEWVIPIVFLVIYVILFAVGLAVFLTYFK